LFLAANHCLTVSPEKAASCVPYGAEGDDLCGGWSRTVEGAVNFGATATALSDQGVFADIAYVRQRIFFRVDATGNLLDSIDPTKDLAVFWLRSRPNIGIGPGLWNLQPVHIGLPPGETFPGATCPFGTFAAAASGWAPDLGEDFPHSTRRIAFFDASCDDTCGGSPTTFSLRSGDSGGPLFDTNGDPAAELFIVCGVASEGTAEGAFGGDIWTPTASAGNTGFLQDIARKPDGSWAGECPPIHDPPTEDPDGDGVPTACDDDCPHVFNPSQLDTDADGLGDACDNCPESAGASQVDSNLDAEVEEYGISTLSSPPCREHPFLVDPCTQPHPTSSVSLDAWLGHYFPGDACDTNPISVLTPTGGAFSAPLSKSGAVARAVDCTIEPGVGCVGAPIPASCPVADGNELDLTSSVGGSEASGADPGNQEGWTATRWCDCPFADSISTGDPDCHLVHTGVAAHCVRDAGFTSGLTSPEATWHRMTLRQETTPFRAVNSPVLGFQDYATTSFPDLFEHESVAHQELGWDYPSDFFRDHLTLPALPTTTTPVNTILDGVVWTWVRSYGPTLPDVATDPTGVDFNIVRRQVVTRVLVTERLPILPEAPPCIGGSSAIYRVPALEGVSLTGFCATCGWAGYSSIIDLHLPSGPLSPLTVIEAPGLLASRNITSSLDPTLVAALELPNATFIPTSDGLEQSAGTAIGGIVDQTTHQILAVVRSVGGSLIATLPSQPPRNVDPPLVAAASARRQEMAFFGESDSTGKLLDQVRVFDFDRGVEVIKPIVSDQKPSAPIAATYRVTDDAYYVLDRVAGKGATFKIRLVRFPRGMTAEPFLHLRIPPGAFSNFGLTTGTDSTLVVSAWSKTRHAIAVISLEPDGTLKVVGGWRGKGPLAIAAFRGLDGTFFVPEQAPGSPPPKPVSVDDAKGEVPDSDRDDHSIIARLEALFS
jgi:hypothetical protein